MSAYLRVGPKPRVIIIIGTQARALRDKSVHAAQNTPENVPVGLRLYLGKVVDGDVADGRWCVSVR